MKKILYALSVVFVLSFFALPLTTAGAVQIDYNVSLGDFYEDNVCYYITKNAKSNANGEVVVAGCSDSLTKLVIPTVIKHNYHSIYYSSSVNFSHCIHLALSLGDCFSMHIRNSIMHYIIFFGKIQYCTLA